MRWPLVIFCLAWASGNAQEFSLGEAREVPEPVPELPIHQYSPDGHCTVMSSGTSYMMFWPGEDSYRTTGASVFQMGDCVKVLSRGAREDFDNGGAWLYAVFRRSGDRMIGFYHAEDHVFPDSPDSRVTAYKSIARSTSDDSGLTWKNREQILTAHKPKPRKSAWSGLGDHCTIRDELNGRYLCYFQENGRLCLAMSADPEGRPGTWFKWFRGDFSEPGLGGRATPLPTLARHAGGNPSILWNSYLERWVMVWHRWVGDLWIATSRNLIEWSKPRLLLAKPANAERVWYPTLIGETTESGGRSVTLLHAEFPAGERSKRRFLARELVFAHP